MNSTEHTEGTWATERWTYGGFAQGASTAKVAIWYDEKRTRQAFAPGKGAQPYVGGVYEVEVQHDASGEVLSKKAAARYIGRNDDDEWVAGIEAAAEVARVQLAAAAQERSDKRKSALDAAIEPLEEIAAKMLDPADVDALAMIITRRLHNARYRAASARRRS